MANSSTRVTTRTILELSAEEVEAILKRALFPTAPSTEVEITFETSSAGLFRGVYVERTVEQEPEELVGVRVV